MKKTAVIGMVLSVTMALPAFAAGGAKEVRLAEGKAKYEESLYGKDKAGKANTFASLPEAVKQQKQQALAEQVGNGKSNELYSYLREAKTKEESAKRMDNLITLQNEMTYNQSLGTAEGAAIAKADKAAIVLLANSARANDRGGDASTLALVDRAMDISKWSPTQRENVADIILKQDELMTSKGLTTREALVEAIMVVKKITDIEQAKKLAEEITKLCKA